MSGGSWSVAAFAHWSRKSVQLSLGSGLRGYHVSGWNPDYDPTYLFPQTRVGAAHWLIVPLELRVGGGAIDEWFVYGLVGVELGVAFLNDWGGVGIEPAYNPTKIGVGGYGDVGRGFLVGAEAQTDILAAATGDGMHFDLQLKLGYQFTIGRGRRR